MISGIGTDIVSIKRMERSITSEAFANKVFTRNEIELIMRRSERAAGFFAAKEAFVKALGSGFGLVSPKDIEVSHDTEGKPYFILYGEANKAAEKLGNINIMLSISHEKEFAVAFVIIEGREAV